MSTHAERVATVARLEAEVAASRARIEHRLEVQARFERAIASAVAVYVDAMTAQWRAFADELRAARYSRASSARRPPSR